ncbi:MAG: SDR family oxidoreductase [Porticoccaceae bacterium]|jgi:3-oxoacyl-[acyl-carrier protein] reductase
MDLGITGKIAVVTGGSHGIGRAISEELGRSGCRVVVVARGQARLDDTVRAIESEGGQAVAVSADLLDFASYPRIVAEAAAAFGGAPDIAIYSPVAPPPGAFDEFSDDDFDKSYTSLVKGFAHFVRAMAPGMKDKRWGRIITIGSGCGKVPARYSSLHFHYALANTNRPAALGLSRTVADELGPYGITVNTIPPGFIDTGENYEAFFRGCAEREGQDYETFMANELKRIPLNRFGKPEEISGLCAFLCSQQAGYITGQYIVVDGGHMETYW